MSVGRVNGSGSQPERPEDAGETEEAKGDAWVRPTRRPSTIGVTMMRSFRDNYPPSAIPPMGLPVRALFRETGAAAIRSAWAPADSPERLPSDVAKEFGIGATGWAPQAAESTSHKTWAINTLPPYMLGPGFYEGVTRQVANFPPTPEHPNGTQWTRTTFFMEFRGTRRSKSADTVPGVKIKVMERTRWQDLGYQTLWQRIKEKAASVLSKDSL